MTAIKKIHVVGVVGVPANYGGFETLVDNLVRSRSADVSYTVYCSKYAYSNRLESYEGAQLNYLPLKANGGQSVFFDILGTLKACLSDADTILILGVSGSISLPFFTLLWGRKKKFITNVDGCEWKRQKFGKLKSIFLRVSEFFAVKFSHKVIADNQEILNTVLTSYGVKSELIAYGGDHVLVNRECSNLAVSNYFFSLSRIEPENNVEMIVKSFVGLDEELIYIGNWNSNSYGRNIREKYGEYENIQLLDPVYDLDELFEYRSKCIAYVHGHSAGGTNPSLVEAMHFAKPVLAFDCRYNRYTTSELCGYFSNSNGLREQLINCVYLQQKPELIRALAQKEYTWDKVCHRYECLY